MSYSITTKKSWHETQQELAETFDKWGIRDWQTNYPRGARLTAQWQDEQDRNVILSFTMPGGKHVNLSMNKQTRAVDNLRVLYLAVEDMRMNEKRGIAEVVQSAYMQLGEGNAQKSPYEVLQIMPDAPLEVAEASYKARVKIAHPDAGGSEEQMKELNEAIKSIRQEKKA